MTKNKRPVTLKRLPPLIPTKNPFASLARAILYQQLTGKAAATIERRFLASFPKKVRGYPTPQMVYEMPHSLCEKAGVSRQKEGYLRDLARAFLDGTLKTKDFLTMTDEALRDHLVSVKGIGRWTADMFLIFALCRPNVLPCGDLAIRKGFMHAWRLKKEPDEKRMRQLALPYEGKYTDLSRTLWMMMDETNKK